MRGDAPHGELTDATNLIRLIQESLCARHAPLARGVPCLRLERKVRFYQASTSGMFGNVRRSPRRRRRRSRSSTGSADLTTQITSSSGARVPTRTMRICRCGTNSKRWWCFALGDCRPHDYHAARQAPCACAALRMGRSATVAAMSATSFSFGSPGLDHSSAVQRFRWLGCVCRNRGRDRTAFARQLPITCRQPQDCETAWARRSDGEAAGVGCQRGRYLPCNRYLGRLDRAMGPNFGASTLLIAFTIALVSPSQSTIDGPRSRPNCRSPIFTVGVPSAGASMMPLDEFPMTASACFSAAK